MKNRNGIRLFKNAFISVLSVILVCFLTVFSASCDIGGNNSGSSDSGSSSSGDSSSSTTHTHTYSEEWSKDSTYHWHAATCEHTSLVSQKGEHVYTDDEDTTCNVCGYERVITPVEEPEVKGKVFVRTEDDKATRFFYVSLTYNLSPGLPDGWDEKYLVTYRATEGYATVSGNKLTINKGGEFNVFATVLDLETGKVAEKVQISQATVNAVMPISNLTVDENSFTGYKKAFDSYERDYVFGGYEFAADGSLQKATLNGKFGAQVVSEFVNNRKQFATVSLDQLDESQRSLIEYSSSDSSIISVGDDGSYTLGDKSGLVTITASVQGLGDDAKSKITIDYKAKGINAYNDEHLVRINKGRNYNAATGEASGTAYTADGYETVIFSDISLAQHGKDIETASELVSFLNNYTTEIAPTADTQFYKNQKQDIKIRVGLEFTGNVYGNGFTVSGQYITKPAIKSGASLKDAYWNGSRDYFDGPIDLVSIKSATLSVSVKSQDNIIFLLKKDGLKLNNVVLKGCDDSALLAEDGNSVDLTKLNNAGTVLEVMGNNCSVSYSEIANGRTCLRVYGKAHTPSFTSSSANDYRISFSINNSKLSYAREFIMKIGSNQVKKIPQPEKDKGILGQNDRTEENYLNASPLLDGYDYTAANYNNAANYNAGADFYNKYVLTDVTVKDCVFEKAGLFCVGLDTSFGGLCLDGWDWSSNFLFGSQLGWKGVAGTMYPSVLRLQGNVLFGDWKDVNAVNSDTIIEKKEGNFTGGGLVGDSLNKVESMFDMNVASLLKKYKDYDGDASASILDTIDGTTDYINGAIAYYGGGKNYSYVDTANLVEKFPFGENLAGKFQDYSVPVSLFGMAEPIYCSAGRENFRFKVYNNTSTFKYQHQNGGVDYSSMLYKK